MRERLLRQQTRRTSNRAPRFDYRSVGWYFVTIVTEGRKCLFGLVVDGEMQPNAAGRLVAAQWLTTHDKRRHVEVDEYVVMPNHMHAIVHITTGIERPAGEERQPARRSPSHSLGAVIRGFKAATTRELNQVANSPGLPLWQRNYHDRVLRSYTEVIRARAYIRDNPANWPNDPHFALDGDDPRAVIGSPGS